VMSWAFSDQGPSSVSVFQGPVVQPKGFTPPGMAPVRRGSLLSAHASGSRSVFQLPHPNETPGHLKKLIDLIAERGRL
ncbi:hypothetical protein, partial [Paracoccus shandongensis]|uniref:hypothetical protein n=1 Tax=Paracoccus shandongensis TaxID=2816048 RepID=UPI001A904C2E